MTLNYEIKIYELDNPKDSKSIFIAKILVDVYLFEVDYIFLY